MPAWFYFDLEHDQGVVRDDEGIEADDLNQAIEQAKAGVEEVRASGDFQGREAGWCLVIRDANGTVLDRLAL